MANRLNGLADAASAFGADAFLVTNLFNVSYLTGFTGSNGFVLAGNGKAYFITDSRYETQSADEVRGFEIIIQKLRWTSEISALIKDAGFKKVCYESRNVTVDTFQVLKDAVGPDVELVPVRDAVERLRVTKDASEIKKIYEAVRRAEWGFNENRPRFAAGITENDAAIGLEFNVRAAGARKMPFDTIVASGYRAALPHGVASMKEMMPGDTLIVDFGGEAETYQSDMTRSGVLGVPDARQREIYDIVLEAQRLAIDLVKPGVSCKEVDEAARGYIRSKGYGDYFGHGLGHGVGLEVHEAPSVSFMSDEILLPGMVITIEPGIYIQDWGGYRIEDMLLVTDDGHEVMTSLPKGIKFE